MVTLTKKGNSAFIWSTFMWWHTCVPFLLPIKLKEGCITRIEHTRFLTDSQICFLRQRRAEITWQTSFLMERATQMIAKRKPLSVFPADQGVRILSALWRSDHNSLPSILIWKQWITVNHKEWMEIERTTESSTVSTHSYHFCMTFV